MNPVKVALYARVSSDQQAEKDNSIPSQLRLLSEYAAKHGYVIIQQYVDEGESARSDARPAFQELVGAALSKDPPFSKILGPVRFGPFRPTLRLPEEVPRPMCQHGFTMVFHKM